MTSLIPADLIAHVLTLAVGAVVLGVLWIAYWLTQEGLR